MRILVGIWAMYIAMAAIYPCCLTHDCMDEATHHLQEALADHTHEDSEEEDHGCMPCSPFHSCQVQVKLNVQAFAILTFQPDSTEARDCYVYALKEGYILDAVIWQPPRA